MKFIRKIKVPKSNMFQKRVKLTQKLSFGFSLIVILLIIFLVVLKKFITSIGILIIIYLPSESADLICSRQKSSSQPYHSINEL